MPCVHGFHYICAQCGGRYKSAWTEEEAVAEAAREFPGLDVNSSRAAIVCDDCYRLLMGRGADKIN